MAEHLSPAPKKTNVPQKLSLGAPALKYDFCPPIYSITALQVSHYIQFTCIYDTVNMITQSDQIPIAISIATYNSYMTRWKNSVHLTFRA
jgi:hypothetical protein